MKDLYFRLVGLNLGDRRTALLMNAAVWLVVILISIEWLRWF